MPVVLQIVHGYPPREQAGTEISTERLVAGLSQRGWTCHVFAATRAPGRRQYELLEEPGITRIVNNLPARSLTEGERDLSIQRALDKLLVRLRPDLVHVQHLAYIGHGIHLPAPTVGTLHDAWPWCPAGGKLLRQGFEPCPGPDPARCGPCHAAWARPSNPLERALFGVAGGLAALGGPSPERLHGLWRALPPALRRAVGRVPASSLQAASARAVSERLELCRALWRRMEVILAPSRYLAALAEAQGLGKVRHLPQGAERGPARVLGGPFLCLGTVAFHKGVHVVVEGFKRAFPHDASRREGLLIHGAGAGETAYEAGLGWPLAGPCPPSDVPSLLSRARALVLGSLWPENAPLVIAEARACGCPVVAPAIGGIPEMLVEGRDGWLYPPGDAEALAACLERIVREPDLPVAAPLDLEQHVELVEAVYLDVLSSRGDARGGCPGDRLRGRKGVNMSSSALERLADRITEHLVAMDLKPSDHPGGPHIFRYGSSMVFVSPFERGEESFVRFSALVLKDFRPNLALLTRVLRLNNELPYGAFLLFEGDTLAFAVTLPGRDLAEATFKKTLHYTAWIADEYDDEFQALGGGLRAEEILAGPEGLNPDSSSSTGSRGSGLAE